MTPHLTRRLVAGFVAISASCGASAQIDLSAYTRIGAYALPIGSAGNLLAQEASSVTYNRDTRTLFVVGDGGTSVTQVSLTGQLIDSMTLAADANQPQGTAFYDPEGLTYIGGGRFVMVEERYRIANLFTYAAGSTLTKAAVQTVKLGTTVGNVGIEGMSFDPLTGGYIGVKEKTPLGVFQTGIDFTAGTATNGSPTTANPTNLFNPALAGVIDFADVFALSNLSTLNGTADFSNLLVLSEESGKIVEIGRDGTVFGSLDIGIAPQHEGLTMDENGVLYVVSELGNAGESGLWVYAAAPVPEPSTWAMLGIGLLGLAWRSRAAR